MEITRRTVGGCHLGEGSPGQPLLQCVADTTALIEVCLTQTIDRLLLYPENLTAAFFDLSSGEAGAILQKLRNYHIRLAVVRTPDLSLSSRFGELLEDERRGQHFRLLADRSAAERWLCAD
jgi:hypothetical protein